MEQFQGYADLGELFMHRLPIGLHEHTLVVTAPREQQRIQLGVAVTDVVVTADASVVGGGKYCQHALARHALRQSDRAPSHALGAELEHPLRLDSSCHC